MNWFKESLNQKSKLDGRVICNFHKDKTCYSSHFVTDSIYGINRVKRGKLAKS